MTVMLRICLCRSMNMHHYWDSSLCFMQERVDKFVAWSCFVQDWVGRRWPLSNAQPGCKNRVLCTAGSGDFGLWEAPSRCSTTRPPPDCPAICYPTPGAAFPDGNARGILTPDGPDASAQPGQSGPGTPAAATRSIAPCGCCTAAPAPAVVLI